MSLRVEPIENKNYSVAMKSSAEQPKIEAQPSKMLQIDLDKTVPLVTAAVALTSLGISLYATKGRSNPAKDETATKAQQELKELFEKGKKELEATTESIGKKIENLTSKVDENTNKIADNQRYNDGYLDALDQKVKELQAKPSIVQMVGGAGERNLVEKDGFQLLSNVANDGKRKPISADVANELKLVAQKYITGKDANGVKLAIPTLAAGATIWLPTAESLPEKEGGLGEVPVQMAMNMDKLGIDNYIVRPLMEIPEISAFYEENGRSYYWYQGFPSKMKIDKVAEFETTAFRNGKYENQPVEVYVGTDPIRGYKRLMFRNKDFFAANGLYKNSPTATEPERYTFFSKVVYDFMKLKADPMSMHGYKIYDKFETIKTPDAIALNDWHTAPIAALMRLKAPVEASEKELNSDVANKFKNMNLMYIVHNCDYQGQEYNHASEIMNTLFDKYALDIYENADTQFGYDGIKNVLTIDSCVNMANMAMTLANTVKPVSKTYAKEMAQRPERSRGLQHVASERFKHGTMVGQSNGWDRSANEITPSSNTFANTEKALNQDRALIEKALQKNPEFDFIAKNSPIREVRPIVSTMSIEEIMSNSNHNKRMFVDYLKSCIDYNKKVAAYNDLHKNDKLPLMNFAAFDLCDLSSVNLDNIENIPVLTMGVRFVEQKGVDIVAGSLEKLYSDWDKLFPGKEKPITVIGGVDDEGPYRKIALELKEKLGQKGERLLYMDGFTPNPAFYAGSDWTLRPSHFEPDGDKWESLYRGTPTIMTKVGGHVDSIIDGYNGFLSKRTITEICEDIETQDLKDSHGKYKRAYLEAMSNDYLEALKRGLEASFGKDQYKQMAENAIRGNQSWVIKDTDGKIKKCALLGHLRDLGFTADHEALKGKIAEGAMN